MNTNKKQKTKAPSTMMEQSVPGTEQRKRINTQKAKLKEKKSINNHKVSNPNNKHKEAIENEFYSFLHKFQ